MQPDSLVPGEVTRATRLFLWLSVLAVVAFFAWAWLGVIDIVSVATGEVAPSGKVKSVQHLEGGIVSEIKVREGEIVESGQPLVVLHSIASDASVEEVKVRINALRAEIARLTAEAEGAEEVEFPEQLVQEAPQAVAQNRELFNERMRSYRSDIRSRRQTIEQRRQEIAEITARLRNNEQRLKLVDEQVALSEELLADNLTTKYKHLAFLSEQTEIRGQINQDRAALAGARSKLAEAGEKLNRITLAFKEKAREELTEARQELDEFLQRLARFKDYQSRTVVRSPVRGVVKALNVVTQGGVVQPGETIMDIVPVEDKLIVEAHLPIGDIGYVHAGQKAFVKLASRDASRFGRIPGEVVRVSPDTFTTADGQTYYRVRVETERDHFSREGQTYRLYPGMLVLAFIHTGKRTVLEYLLDPVLTSMSLTMTER